MDNRDIDQDPDLIYQAFLARAARDADAINAESSCVTLMPGGYVGDQPSRYAAMFRGIEHFVRRTGEEPRLSDDPIFLGVHFPPDYLRSCDSGLIFRVVHVLSPVFMPNVSGITLCLGEAFRPGTSLRALVHQVWGLFAAGRFSTISPLDREAADFYLANIDRVRALRARPLFRTSFVTNIERVASSEVAGRSSTEPKP